MEVTTRSLYGNAYRLMSHRFEQALFIVLRHILKAGDAYDFNATLKCHDKGKLLSIKFSASHRKIQMKLCIFARVYMWGKKKEKP